MAVQIRRVSTIADCGLCQSIASEVWGTAAACSLPQMIVHAKYGGVVLLAEQNHEPVGFLFSFPARFRGQEVLWSHETAVRNHVVHQGIGAELKFVQRQLALEEGYRNIVWTFDPLVARNAYFNLHKLGAKIVEYQRNVYGVDEADLVNRGIETDRFVAIWTTSGDLPDRRAGSQRGEMVKTPIPQDYNAMMREHHSGAVNWRYEFRSTAEKLWVEGYRPVALHRNSEHSAYIWEQGAGE